MRASQSTRLIWYSSAKPLPPWICSALSAAAQATRAPKQLRHAGLEVAAAAGVLLARGEQRELARRHHLGRHQRQLVGNPREGDDGLAELRALPGILQPEVERVLGHAHGARRGLDARGLEGLHQLLEALALDAAEQVLGLDLEILEADFVFLHAAIAQHLDLAAGHALRGKRIVVRAARLFREEHGEAR
jgi:hypothetical protein